MVLFKVSILEKYIVELPKISLKDKIGLQLLCTQILGKDSLEKISDNYTTGTGYIQNNSRPNSHFYVSSSLLQLYSFSMVEGAGLYLWTVYVITVCVSEGDVEVQSVYQPPPVSLQQPRQYTRTSSTGQIISNPPSLISASAKSLAPPMGVDGQRQFCWAWRHGAARIQ